MSYNKVSVLQQDVFYGLKSLVRLHMDHNKIEIVNPNVFYGLTSLRLVHLEGNLLKQLHPDTFVTLNYVQIFKISSIKHIYLSENALTSLPQEMFSYMSELESIYLHGNPWSCDCSLQWFAERSKQRPGELKALFMLFNPIMNLLLSNTIVFYLNILPGKTGNATTSDLFLIVFTLITGLFIPCTY